MLHHNIDVLESRDFLSDHHQQPRYSIAANVRILLQRVVRRHAALWAIAAVQVEHFVCS